ncbi:hypothetical protein M3A89_07610 [Corynebacterium sanguinis]|uniref:DUF732 domain-containing protein n=2 Tax=Corynebacterium sanguinis TaxID=2594913 RepID=A0A6C1TVS1_9CORY|nr:hypothetical protein [Corynebacterium sanguinis]MBA4505135.1 hypothetical protein [Corynebacterium sanguinis]MCT1695581.1 hypothetical protein [Corynebacterium sanguinis]MCT1715003.1 hypothetical protein [Corynebacterium sanguinis]TVS27460.1 hypothetical protein EKI59_08710 [Corynebacterium sanguinis]
MRNLLAAAAIAAGCALTACGSSTVDSSEVTSAQTSSSMPATTTESTETTATTSTTTTSAAPRPAAPAPGADAPAQEVESVPEQGPAFTPEEDAYLEALRNQGINVQGVEAQLTATGVSVCDGSTIIRDAVAGQLIEQRRTELAPDAVSTLIDDSAHEHLC